jgi:hypothetical protein
MRLASLALALALATGACSSGGSIHGVGGGGSGGATSAPTSTIDPCKGIDTSSDPLNCGACGRTCVLPHGTAACAAGECVLDACDLGFADCDGDVENGCEVKDACVDGEACMTSCGSLGAIACADACAPVCTPPAEACNALDDNCDGACDEGALPGCRVGVHRAFDGTKGHLFTTDLAEAVSWGLETANYFYLYVDAAADLRPFFRCAKSGTPNYFYSESNDCEMTGAPLLTVGFIAPSPMAGSPPTCGSTALYRLRNPGLNWHFYTTSAPERDSAVANGWVDEGVAGYVWQGP